MPKKIPVKVIATRTGTRKLVRPKRPLSAYNIFLQYERVRLLNCRNRCEGRSLNLHERRADHLHTRTPVNLTPTDIRSTLSTDPHRIDRTKRRRHRKSHGALSFKELTETVSRNWKELDAKSKSSFEALAAEQKVIYVTEMAKYRRCGGSTTKDKAREDTAVVKVTSNKKAGKMSELYSEHRQDARLLSLLSAQNASMASRRQVVALFPSRQILPMTPVGGREYRPELIVD